jgi:glycyl-tRNA synthetase beta chain
LFENQSEKDLHNLFLEVSAKMQVLIAQKEYLQALVVMLMMKQPVDTFFDEVMVMAEDLHVRQNRLNMLTAIGELILQIGDISKMQQG